MINKENKIDQKDTLTFTEALFLPQPLPPSCREKKLESSAPLQGLRELNNFMVSRDITCLLLRAY